MLLPECAWNCVVSQETAVLGLLTWGMSRWMSQVCLSVCRRSQTAGRNSCSIVSGDVSNCSYHLTVHTVTSSRHSLNIQNLGEIGWPARVCLNDPATGYECQRRGAVTVGRNWIVLTCTDTHTHARARACIRLCMCALAHAWACVHARACVRACVMCLQHTIIIFDPGW